MLIPIHQLSSDREKIETLLRNLRLDPVDFALNRGDLAAKDAIVRGILADVANRGDEAVADVSRKFDDPGFDVTQIRIHPDEMRDAARRVPGDQLKAIRHAIRQVREYQTHMMPPVPPTLTREGVELGMRYTPIDSVGLHIPGGKAAYPSSVIMLAIPAQVAGVKRLVVCSPPSKFGRSDLVLATYLELGLSDVFRAGGAAAIAAMAFGTETIPAVDKILGPGNLYTQLAKRALAGCVGVDGFLGPSEILTLADESGNPAFIASDLLAQAEHDPGSCFLLTTSRALADAVVNQIATQSNTLSRNAAIAQSLKTTSAIINDPSMDRLIDLANRVAAEHVNLQVREPDAVMRKLVHGGAFFIGPHSPVAAGDYVAGPSHCLPTNTTARFSSGVSVYEFLKRSSIEKYDRAGLAADAMSIVTLANAEGLDAHAESVKVRMDDAGMKENEK